MWFVVAITPISSPPPPPRPPPPLFYEPTPLDLVLRLPGAQAPAQHEPVTQPQRPVPPPRVTSKSKVLRHMTNKIKKCHRSFSMSVYDLRARARKCHSAAFSPDCKECPLALNGYFTSKGSRSGRASACSIHQGISIVNQVLLTTATAG